MIEKDVRKLAKTKFIKLRNILMGVRAYLPNGVDYVTFNTWEEAYKYVKQYE